MTPDNHTTITMTDNQNRTTETTHLLIHSPDDDDDVR